MSSLKDLKALDDGSFDRMIAEISQISRDEKEQLRLLTERVVKEFINSFSKKAKEEANSINRASSCEEKNKKRRQISDTEEEGRKEKDEGNKKLKKRKTKPSLKLTGKKRCFDGDAKSNDHEADKAMKPKKRAKTLKINIEQLGLDQFPCVPADLRNHIERKGINISDLKLVIVKQLFDTDLQEHHGRLTMPVNQVFNEEFLTSGEKKLVDEGKSIDVTFIDPTLEETTMCLKKWKMSNTLSYVLITGWKSILKNIKKIHVRIEGRFVNLRVNHIRKKRRNRDKS